MMPPIPTIPPDEFIALGKLNPKFVERVEGRTQKDSFIGERLLKFENTFRVGTNGLTNPNHSNFKITNSFSNAAPKRK